jgi:hypothetical protein
MKSYKLIIDFGFGLSKEYEFKDLKVATERFNRKKDLFTNANITLMDNDNNVLITTYENK